ncbi:MAG: helix-hairpin-helix domain-containing protein [Deltaproteobacteria bacterium]|nr:helix-hairpin-helix domain-containing protein [Deltaproteobacteria bacterium]
MKKSELEIIPGVGKSIAADLERLGISRVADLRGRDPQELYDQLRELSGGKLDRCVLYVFRCAVHFAEHSGDHFNENSPPDPELLKWWNWSDENLKKCGIT